MSNARNWLAVMALMAGFVTVGAATDASANGCSSGEFCIWGEDSYTGCHYENPNSIWNLHQRVWHNCSPVSPANGANSFKNLGNSCNVSMWDWNNYSGGNKTATRIGQGGWWADPNLWNNSWSNGGTIENDMQSFRWCY